MSNLRASSKVFRLSDEQYQAMSGYFTKYDQDLDGELNFKELQDLVRGVGHYQDGTDLETNTKTLMSKLDTGGNGTLGFNEFLRGYERMLANAGSEIASLDILHVAVSEKEKATKAAEKAKREAEELAAKEAAEKSEAERAAAENAKIELNTGNQAGFSAVAQEKPQEELSINQNETTFDDDLELDDSESSTGRRRNPQANQSRELNTDNGVTRDLDTAQAENLASQRAAAAQAAVEKASADKAAAEKAAADKAAADKAASEKAAADKATADKAAADKAASEKAAADKAAADKAAAEKAAADKAAADKAASEKAAADKAASEKAAADKAAADKAAAEKLSADRSNAQKEAAERALADKVATEKAANERTESETKGAAGRRNVVILEWPYGGTVVLVGGTFNNWELVPMTNVSGNLWRYEVYDVPPTTSLLYKFHVDGYWSEDQHKPIDNNERIDGWPVINNQIYA